MNLAAALKRFWNFLKEDSWQSMIVFILLLVLFIKFVFFPFLSFLTNSPLPLVVVESCSMYHGQGFDEWWESNSEWYELNGISGGEFREFSLKNGLNKGDIIFVWNRFRTEEGDVIIFSPGADSEAANPIIHRVVSLNPIGTKGDNNPNQLSRENNFQLIDETNIDEERVLGKAAVRVPVLGWIKLIFFEFSRDSSQRGFC